MSKPALACDTSVMLYLGRIGRADLLPARFEPVYVPDAVALELAAGRLLRPDTLDPQTLPWAVPVTVADLAALPPNRLGPGEQAALACARAHPGCWVGLDDRQARSVAEALGLPVVGTVGILLKAKRDRRTARLAEMPLAPPRSPMNTEVPLTLGDSAQVMVTNVNLDRR